MPFQCKYIFINVSVTNYISDIVMIQLSAMCFTMLLVYWSVLYSESIIILKTNIKRYFIFLKETWV